MIATIHQPEYLPYLGFFDRIDMSDVFVILDTVKYEKNGFNNRNKIKDQNGTRWITVPVRGDQKSEINGSVEIATTQPWKHKHWNSIKVNYQKAPYFKDYGALFEDAILKKDFKLICDLDVHLLNVVLDILGIHKKIVKSSDINPVGKATDLNLDICKKLGATKYLSGPGGKNYLQEEKFEKENIKVIFQEFSHPEYNQLFPEKGFLPYMSVIDLLFNHGPKSLEIIRSGRKNI